MAVKIAELFDVSGLATVVTGAASGIGYGICEVMAANGARLAIFDIDAEGLEKAADQLRAFGGEVRTEYLDVTDKSALDAAMARTVEDFGRLDVVFANAGVSGGPGFTVPDGSRPVERMIENTDPALLERVLDINVRATFLTIQSCVPHLKASGGGRIILTSSISATHTELMVGASYVVSKAGVGMLVKQAARELAAYGILVNAISPGPVITNIGGGRLKDPAARGPFNLAAPLGKVAAPEDLFGAVIYLASPASSHVTGAEILIDGGISLGPDIPAGAVAKPENLR